MSLLWKEWRVLWLRCAVALGQVALGLVLIGELGRRVGPLETALHLFVGDATSVLHGNHPGVVIALGLLLSLWACAVGHDAVAGETAENTWTFLRSRPMRARGLVAAKLAPRAALVVLPFLLYRGAVFGYLFWGAPFDSGLNSLSAEQQLDAQYILTSPPYSFVYGEVLVLVHALQCLALAVIMGSFTGNKGLAFGASLVGGMLLATVEFWLFEDAWTTAATQWQAPVSPFLAVCTGAVALMAVAVARVATPGPLLTGGRIWSRVALPDTGALMLWVILFVAGFIVFIMWGGSPLLFGAEPGA